MRLLDPRSEYNLVERTALVAEARHLAPEPSSCVGVGSAGRAAVDQSLVEDALGDWRQAISHAIHAGLVESAAGWLKLDPSPEYPRRRQTSLTTSTTWPAAGALGRAARGTFWPLGGPLAIVPTQPSSMTSRARQSSRARRWLVDSVVTGNWASEHDALELLGDLYSENQEPDLAGRYYQRAGETKKLTELVKAVGDHLLAVPQLSGAPWWELRAARAHLLAQQADLIDDRTAAARLCGPHRTPASVGLPEN